MKKTEVKKHTGKLEKKEIDPAKNLTRRDFVQSAWKILGFVAIAEVIVVVTSYIFSPKQKKEAGDKKLLEAGPVDSFSLNTVSPFMGGRFYLARQQDGGFIALSLRCTHLGCSISWEEDKNRFICPCHSSSFTISGEVLNPPAVRALDYYPVLIENGIVKVDVNNLKERKSFRKDQLQYA